MLLAAPVLISIAAEPLVAGAGVAGGRRAAGRRWCWSRSAAGRRCAGWPTCCGSSSGWPRAGRCSSPAPPPAHPGPPSEPDLPGVLTRLRFPDGPMFADRGRICLIHDTVDGRWGATAQLTHTGTGMLSPAECDQLAARLGTLLTGLGHRGVVDRLSLYVRTVPDDGAEYQLWRARHARPDAPALAHRATRELDATIGSVSLRTELFVCVSGREDVLRRPADAAGGGVAGRAHALYRVLDGIEDGLTTAGCAGGDLVDQRADGGGAAHRVQPGHRGRPGPGAAARPRRRRAADGRRRPHPGAHPGGPGLSPRRVRLGQLRGADAGQRADLRGVGAAARGAGRRGTAHAGDPLRGALRAGVGARGAAAAVPHRHRRRRQGQPGLRRHRRPTSGPAVGARDQEHAIAAGAAQVRFAVAASVTVPVRAGRWRTTRPGWRTTPPAAYGCCAWSSRRTRRSWPRRCRSGSGCPACAEPCRDPPRRRRSPAGLTAAARTAARPARRPTPRRAGTRRGPARRPARPPPRRPAQRGTGRRPGRATPQPAAAGAGEPGRGAAQRAPQPRRRVGRGRRHPTVAGLRRPQHARSVGCSRCWRPTRLPPVGARMGYDALSGSAFYCHPIEWVLREGLATNPNLMIFGEPGRGKSSTVVAFCLRMMLFGVQTLISGDVKGEYTPLLRALGVTPIALGRGSRAPAQRAGPGPAGQPVGVAGRWRGSARSSPG